MKKKTLLSAAIVTAAVMALSLGLTVYAAGSTDSSITDEGTAAVTTEESTQSGNAITQNKPDGSNALCELTEEQRTALKTAMTANLKTALQALIDDKTITQEQADAILAHKKGSLRDSDLTTAQKDAVKATMKNARTQTIEQLVKDGTLTAEQAEQLSKRPEKGHGSKGHGGAKQGQCPNETQSDSQE